MQIVEGKIHRNAIVPVVDVIVDIPVGLRLVGIGCIGASETGCLASADVTVRNGRGVYFIVEDLDGIPALAGAGGAAEDNLHVVCICVVSQQLDLGFHLGALDGDDVRGYYRPLVGHAVGRLVGQLVEGDDLLGAEFKSGVGERSQLER